MSENGYRTAAKVQTDPFLVAWARLRRRRRLVKRTIIVSVIVVGAGSLALCIATGNLVWLLAPAALGGAGPMLAQEVSDGSFRCPRCRGAFAAKDPESHARRYRDQCTKCGIVVGTPHDL